jgi:hypothetical protein
MREKESKSLPDGHGVDRLPVHRLCCDRGFVLSSGALIIYNSWLYIMSPGE